MSRKNIPEVLPDLPARAPDELPIPVRAQAGLSYHTLILDTEDTTDVELLRVEGYIASYVVLPKTDGTGHYIQALVAGEALREMDATNQTYRLVERGRLRAAVKEDFPLWARAKYLDAEGVEHLSAEPAHAFLGIAVGSANAAPP